MHANISDGKTGIPYVDANMRELKITGFLSNRGRQASSHAKERIITFKLSHMSTRQCKCISLQNVSSFLTKDLKLDWRLGAEWFESQLVCTNVITYACTGCKSALNHGWNGVQLN